MTVISIIVSTLFFIGSSWGFDAFFHNVSSEIYVAVQGGALGLFCAFITIIKNNRNQENNVSFYT